MTLKYGRALNLIVYIFLADIVVLLLIRNIDLGNDFLFEQIVISSVLGNFALLFFFPPFQILKFALHPQKLLTCLAILLTFQYLAQSTILNIDRSRSFYVLSWAHNNSIRISNNEVDLSKVESDEKFSKIAISERINEQVSRKFLRKDGSSYYLTWSGNLMFMVANLTGRIFKLEMWERNRN